MSVDLLEAELVGNSGPYTGCGEDLSLLKVAAAACSVYSPLSPSPVAIVPVTLGKMSNMPITEGWGPQDPAS